MNLFAELQRRNVIRMAGLYLVAAWLVAQVCEVVLPPFDVPNWVMRSILILLAIGFVPALVFAWVFEWTPQGFKRDEDVRPEESIAPLTAQRMNRIIIGLLAVALTYFAVDKFVLAPQRDTALAAQGGASTEAAQARVAAKSIAVLPFADFSPGGDQTWFADGLSEEILTTLSRTPDLLVSARTSSFRYKGSELTVPQIASELGVAHVLEGSVRSTPQRIRVTAQLIRASDGFHLWSQTYDRDVADMIGIQEDLARAIATAMQTSMDPQALADMALVGTRSVEAYQAFLRGVAVAGTSDNEAIQRAYTYFEQARSLDPGFAAAHAYAASYWQEQLDPTRTGSGLSDATPQEADRHFRQRIDAAIDSAPPGVARLGYEGAKAHYELRLRRASELYQEAFARQPNNEMVAGRALDLAQASGDMALLRRNLDLIWDRTDTSVEMATQHVSIAYRTNDVRYAADRAEQLVQRWPDTLAVIYQAQRALLWDGRVQAAAALVERWQKLADPAAIWYTLPMARQACAEGRRDDAERWLAALPVDAAVQRWQVLMLLGREDEAYGLLEPFARNGQLYVLAGFLSYPEFDARRFPALMQVLDREQVTRAPARAIPYACPPATASTPAEAVGAEP